MNTFTNQPMNYFNMKKFIIMNIDTKTQNKTVTPNSKFVNWYKSLCLLVVGLVSALSAMGQFTENFDAVPTAQFTYAGTGTQALNNTYIQQGTGSIYLTYVASNTGALAMTTGIDLSLLSSPKLSFYHICATESGFDYGRLEYSTDGGTVWTGFATTSYLGQGVLKNAVVSWDKSSYPDWNTLFTASGTTPGTGPGGALWKQEIIDLSAFSAQTNFKIRFRISSDASVQYNGWYIDRLSINSTTALSGTYTIDNTAATAGTNYNNFRDAITDLNMRGVSAATTFNVTAGQTFAENPPAIIATGTVANPIIFQKTAGANPIINTNGGTGNLDAGIAINGGDYITLDGIDIAVTGALVNMDIM